MAENTQSGGLSLVDYARRERIKDCLVCTLPDNIRAEVKAASSKKIKRGVVVAWLRDVHKIDMPIDAMMAHSNGHHDE
ncbi:MAG: hypothetical protein IT341_10805 [Chloroflexi bacterium]|nr:hypothetical protein [Chloroflexota bacterium]